MSARLAQGSELSWYASGMGSLQYYLAGAQDGMAALHRPYPGHPVHRISCTRRGHIRLLPQFAPMIPDVNAWHVVAGVLGAIMHLLALIPG